MELSERKQKILAAVVEHYILTGEPIGSKVLSQNLDITVSSATIRNEMSELAELGLLEQPYTSAGRIPSQAGYRYYVDRLMPKHPLSQRERKQIADMIPKNAGDPESVLETVGAALAHMTGCAALATTPAGQADVIRKVELVPVGRTVCMIILLTSNGILKNRVCRTDTLMTQDTVATFYQVVNRHFINFPVAEVSTAMLQTLAAGLGEKAFVMVPLLVALMELAQDAAEAEIHLDGQTNLLGKQEYGGSVRELLEFLSRREALHSLVTSNQDVLKVLIGRENLYQELSNSSMILSKYSVGGKAGGVIGIIGPTRIDYAQLIPSIEYLSMLVGNLLSDTLNNDY